MELVLDMEIRIWNDLGSKYYENSFKIENQSNFPFIDAFDCYLKVLKKIDYFPQILILTIFF
jgi:hypothetical protein